MLTAVHSKRKLASSPEKQQMVDDAGAVGGPGGPGGLRPWPWSRPVMDGVGICHLGEEIEIPWHFLSRFFF